ncbi:ubiquitin-like protein Pup [Nocardioides sp. ChNu-153]|uniref:ubiquitin-like protein Pup n=1 Tax=unclassified Nocardioides TaxID=2615069 RepID=UPI002404C18C|nr:MULTISPECIES: ubiquitin-like protein Pup [unclassified Nocardioides]MDF9717410.1 ubiquitin-like protein Pup [Nocardioides sp. ChNu-99]MDN7122204.1 ubiquitin-like protein Pup [Nocardioides sp. ChNu-153]
MAQEQKKPHTRGDEVEEVAPEAETDVAERKEALDDDVDSILDEIDDVLEQNAEDFVKSFIQKGGQ